MNLQDKFTDDANFASEVKKVLLERAKLGEKLFCEMNWQLTAWSVAIKNFRKRSRFPYCLFSFNASSVVLSLHAQRCYKNHNMIRQVVNIYLKML